MQIFKHFFFFLSVCVCVCLFGACLLIWKNILHYFSFNIVTWNSLFKNLYVSVGFDKRNIFFLFFSFSFVSSSLRSKKKQALKQRDHSTENIEIQISFRFFVRHEKMNITIVSSKFSIIQKTNNNNEKRNEDARKQKMFYYNVCGVEWNGETETAEKKKEMNEQFSTKRLLFKMMAEHLCTKKYRALAHCTLNNNKNKWK